MNEYDINETPKLIDAEDQVTYEVQFNGSDGAWHIDKHNIDTHAEALDQARMCARTYRMVRVVETRRTETVTRVWET